MRLKRYAILLSFVLLVCLLTSCGSENSVIDKTTFVMEMDKSIVALELKEFEASILLTELFFIQDSILREEKVNAFQEEVNKIVLEAEAIKPPKDKAAREIHSIYVDMAKEKMEVYGAMFSMFYDLDLGRILEAVVATEGEHDTRWQEFKSNWSSYKSS